MNHLKKAGFTIIETMLFLAITGLLIVVILVGAGGSINVQRYRDSVNSLQSFIQQQYSEVSEVRNTRDNKWTCDMSGDAVVDNTSGMSRGRSDNCVLIGRLITVNDEGTKLYVARVVASIDSSRVTQKDAELLKDNIKILPDSEETYEVEWGSSLVKAKLNDPIKFSILVIRSPINGVIRTYLNNSDLIELEAPNSITLKVLDDSIPADQKTSIKMCVNSNGLFGGTRMAILIDEKTSNASGVEILGDANSQC